MQMAPATAPRKNVELKLYKKMAIICPAASPITSLVAQSCPEIFDQIQAVAFQEVQASAPFADETAIQTLSNWTTLLAAVDATKVQVARVSNPVIEASEPLTVGGNDNTTVDGIPEYNGEGFTQATWEFRNIDAENKRALLDYVPHSITSVGDTNLQVFFFLRGNKILYNAISAEVNGFPMYNFRVGSVASAGLNAQNVFASGGTFGEGWENWFSITQASFTIADVLP